MNTTGATTPARCEWSCDRPADDTLVVRFVGSWTIRAGLPAATEVQQQFDATPRVRQLAFDTRDLTAWDSSLLTFLRLLIAQSTHRQIVVNQGGLPEGVQRLLALAAAVPERAGTRRGGTQCSWLARIGTVVLSGWQGAWDVLGFMGEVVLACGRLARGGGRAFAASISPFSSRSVARRPWAL